ncbi:YkgJ family cysteine cluster protein [bacterium]|nr:YkgJ family cysteine cluster protein [bacterium]
MNKRLSSPSPSPQPESDPGRPSSWQAYSDGLCQDCQALCCTLPVEVSPGDLVRLGLLTEIEAQGSLHQAARKLQKLGVIQAFLPSAQAFILGQTVEGSCRYLDHHKRCSVYELRPDVCRTFPSIGPRPGYCPATSRHARSRKAFP